MNITKTPTENACMFLLQKNISLELNNKPYKQGKLIIFYQKNFYLTFVIDTVKNKREKIEIPIPFGVEMHEDDDLVFFDYRLKTLAKQAPEVENYLRVYSSKKNSNKFWNSILTISAGIN
jgi:hypothetical protein